MEFETVARVEEMEVSNMNIHDEVQEMKKRFLKKQHSASLATDKIVYARDEDPVDTVIVRSLYPKLKDCNKAFGMKGSNVVELVFYSMLKLTSRNIGELQKKLKYIKKEELEEIEKFYNRVATNLKHLKIILIILPFYTIRMK